MAASERTVHNAVNLARNPEFRAICQEIEVLGEARVIREAAIIACLSEGPNHVSRVLDVVHGATIIIRQFREGESNYE